MFRSLGSISEAKFDTELNLTRSLSCVQGTERRVSNIGIEADKVRMVEDVEELRPELESVTLAVSKVLRHRNIEISDGHSAH